MIPAVDLTALVAKAHTLGARPVAVEARASAGSYDPVAKRLRPCVVVSIVTAQPSYEDSRYQSQIIERVITEDATAEAATIAGLTQLAASLAVPIHVIVENQTWISTQPAPPARQWSARWTTTTWGDDGGEVHGQGEASLTAVSGRAALELAHTQIFGPHVSPCLRTLSVPELSAHPQVSYYKARCPVDASTVDAARAMALAGVAVSTIVDELLPALATLQRMVVIEHAFDIDLMELAPLAAYAKGACDRSALDAALTPLVEERRPRWSLVGALRDAHDAGAPIGPVLRAHHAKGVGTIHMMIAFREAFSLGLAAAKMVVSNACDGLHDDDVQALLAEALAERPPG